MITIRLLPPNATRVTQPMVIGVTKQNFRRHCLDAAPTDKGLDAAIYMIRSAWSKVQGQTKSHCFRKAGFTTTAVTPELGEGDVLQYKTDVRVFKG